LVCKAAGLIAGSIPTKGIFGYCFRKILMAFVVAVLQATTMVLHCLFS